ncbi:MAG: InlB B-repeat-containing protein [Bacteroidales bacterium]
MKKYFKFMTAALFMASTLLVGCNKDEVVDETKFTLSLTASPEEGGIIAGGGEYPKGTEVTAMAVASAGYTFDGWYEGSQKLSGSENYSFKLVKNISLEAKFTKEVKVTKYTLTLTANPTDYGKVEGGGKLDSGKRVMAKAIANERYKFVAWFEGEDMVSDEATYYFTLTGDRTLVAHFETIPMSTLILNVNDNKGGTVKGGGDYPTGEEVTATATANKDYEFVAWYEGDVEVSKTATYTFKLDNNRTLTAKFQLSPIIISDKNFLNELLSQGLVVEVTIDGIKTHEATSIGKEYTTLFLMGKGIKDLTGIALFPNLETLICSGNALTSLDVSKNTKLKELYCDENQLTSLDVTKLSLSTLHCYGNRLSTLNASSMLLNELDALECGMQKSADGESQKLKLTLSPSGIAFWKMNTLDQLPNNQGVELQE